MFFSNTTAKIVIAVFLFLVATGFVARKAMEESSETAASPAAKETGIPEFYLSIKNHVFQPLELNIPANTKVRVVIDNQDPTPEEFEMHNPRLEKVIAANSKGSVFVGPLAAGEYAFVGEFHEDVAKGKIIVK